MPTHTSVKLNTGAEMPTVGLGTWKSKPGDVEGAVAHALKAGYRHIDTATAYGNEAEVGKGIKDSGVPRNEIFLTTKLNNPDQKDPTKALEFSLKSLDTEYLDLWLMHWPAPMLEDKDGAADKSRDWLDAWKEMARIQRAHPEKVRAIGVSNFSIKFLTRLLENSDFVPAVNQVELHPACPQEELVEFCKKHGITVTGYSPLGSDNSPLLTHEVVKKVADRHNVHPANILISLQANREGVSVLPKSVTPSRLEANLKVVDLTEEEIAELHAIDKTLHFRACHPKWTGWGSLGFPDCLDADAE